MAQRWKAPAMASAFKTWAKLWVTQAAVAREAEVHRGFEEQMRLMAMNHEERVEVERQKRKELALQAERERAEYA